MTAKVKAGHIMAYLLIVLLLILNMTTAIAFSAAGSAMPSSGFSVSGAAGSTTIHNGLGDPDSAEIFEEIYPTWDIQLGYQILRESYIVPALTVSTDADSPGNGLFVFPEGIFMKLDSGIIAVFMQNKDGMK
ncbi:MAG: hypothetical protein EOM54_08340 [Clostridia bacterium]|nr:hypothetical protein [Clostridia bacterium]